MVSYYPQNSGIANFYCESVCVGWVHLDSLSYPLYWSWSMGVSCKDPILRRPSFFPTENDVRPPGGVCQSLTDSLAKSEKREKKARGIRC